MTLFFAPCFLAKSKVPWQNIRSAWQIENQGADWLGDYVPESTQETTKNLRAEIQKFFVGFLEEVFPPKGHFEINWPLQKRPPARPDWKNSRLRNPVMIPPKTNLKLFKPNWTNWNRKRLKNRENESMSIMDGP